ncbi:hypothetical protein C8R44DRAFT_745914 [Mycena epipterygia]|nr:hypothetical protein C8R44DRAFT_745914 [Mycena epipterygia]
MTSCWSVDEHEARINVNCCGQPNTEATKLVPRPNTRGETSTPPAVLFPPQRRDATLAQFAILGDVKGARAEISSSQGRYAQEKEIERYYAHETWKCFYPYSQKYTGRSNRRSQDALRKDWDASKMRVGPLAMGNLSLQVNTSYQGCMERNCARGDAENRGGQEVPSGRVKLETWLASIAPPEDFRGMIRLGGDMHNIGLLTVEICMEHVKERAGDDDSGFKEDGVETFDFTVFRERIATARQH